MNTDETKKAIAVMQAYVDGAKIEVRHRRQTRALGGSSWTGLRSPTWDWVMWDYRVSASPEPRPFTPAEAASHLGAAVQRCSSKQPYTLASLSADSCDLHEIGARFRLTVDYATLALEFKFENGEPCGVLVPQP